MEVEKKIRKTGNSLGVVLPSDFLKYIGAENGDTVYISLEEDEIIIRSKKSKEKRDQFKERVLEIIEEYMKNEESKQ